MNNEKYINYYVEILGSTLSDAVLRNVSLQANEKISGDVIKELQTQIELAQNGSNNQVVELRKEIESLKTDKVLTVSERQKQLEEEVLSLKNAITMHVNTNSELKAKVDDLSRNQSEYENTKHQLAHVDTFRNELIKTQKELEESKKYQSELNDAKNQLQALNGIISEKNNTISSLTEKIESLQITPAKRKKVAEVKTGAFEQFTSESNVLIEDGGSF